MTALVVIEAVAICLLGLLVAGLLRSHAEILRTLHDLGASMDPALGAERGTPSVTSVPDPRSAGRRPAPDLSGTTPSHEAVNVSLGGTAPATLVVFLSSTCLACADLWESFANPPELGLPEGVRPVVVTKGPDAESISKVQELAPGDVTTVMSSAAWQDYRVPMAPYFVLVDGGSSEVVGEGAASTWDQVRSLLNQALADTAAAGPTPSPGRAAPRPTAAERQALEEEKLLAAGIGPGHPSLQPALDDDRQQRPE